MVRTTVQLLCDVHSESPRYLQATSHIGLCRRHHRTSARCRAEGPLPELSCSWAGTSSEVTTTRPVGVQKDPPAILISYPVEPSVARVRP